MRFLQGALLGSVASLVALFWAITRRRTRPTTAELPASTPVDRFPAAFQPWIDESPPLDDPVEEVAREMEVALA